MNDKIKFFILTNNKRRWNLSVLLASILSPIMISWNTYTFFEVLFLILFFISCFKIKEKLNKKYISNKEIKKLIKRKINFHEKNHKEFNCSILFDEGKISLYNKGSNTSSNSNFLKPKEIVYFLDCKKAYFAIDFSMLTNEVLKEFSKLTVREYLDGLELFKNVEIKNQEDKVIDTLKVISGLDYLYLRTPGVFKIDLLNTKEAQKINSKKGLLYLKQIFSLMFISMLIVSMLIPLNSLILNFMITIIIGDYIKKKLTSKLNSKIVRNHILYIKEKAFKELSKIKNGLVTNYNILEIKDDELFLRSQSKVFNSDIYLLNEKLETGISDIRITDDGTKLSFNLKILNKPVDDNYLELLKGLDLTMQDALTDEARMYYELNFNY